MWGRFIDNAPSSRVIYIALIFVGVILLVNGIYLMVFGKTAPAR